MISGDRSVAGRRLAPPPSAARLAALALVRGRPGGDDLDGGGGDDSLDSVDGVGGNDANDGGRGFDGCAFDPSDGVINCET